MNDIQVFDKIIPAGYSDQIEQDISRSQFPWFYIDDVTNRNYGNNSGFVHMAYDFGTQPSDWFPFIKPVIYGIEEATGHKIFQLLRIRVGLLTRTTEPDYDYNTPHLDFLEPHYTACYYVSDSDGDTVLFDQTFRDAKRNEWSETVMQDYVKNNSMTIAHRCAPKKGRLCVFDGLRFHSSSKPKQHERRVVITINYKTEEQHAQYNL